VTYKDTVVARVADDRRVHGRQVARIRVSRSEARRRRGFRPDVPTSSTRHVQVTGYDVGLSSLVAIF
jgi:hypothetical protein